MANNKYGNGMEYKQRDHSRVVVHPVGIGVQLPYYKRVIEMAQVKWALIICDMLGVSATLMGIFANWENVKSTVLFFLALIFLMVRIYFYVVQRRQAVKEKDIEIWHLEQDRIERKNKK